MNIPIDNKNASPWVTVLQVALTLLTIIFILVFSVSPIQAAEPAGHLVAGKSAVVKVLFVSARHSNTAKVHLLKAANKDIEGISVLDIDMKSDKELGGVDEAITVFSAYKLVVLDAVSSRTAKQTYAKYEGKLAGTQTQILSIKESGNSALRNNVSASDAKDFHDYYDNGGEENFSRLANFIEYRILKKDIKKDIKSPIIFPSVGLYYPEYNNLIFSDRAAYYQWRGAPKPSQKVIGVNIQRSAIEANNTVLIDETIKRIEAQGHYAYPFFFELSPRASDYSHLLLSDDNRKVSENNPGVSKLDGSTVVDAIINLRSIHWAKQRKKEFERFGVPVIQAQTFFGGDQKMWEKSTQGLSANMMAFTLVLPESAGVIDPIVIAAMNPKSQNLEIIDYQLDFLIARTLNYTALKSKDNADKKITTLFWGDRDMGASFLNVPESLRAISHRLNNEGYSIDKVDAEYFTQRVDQILDPFYRDFELEQLLQADLADLLPLADYEKWLSTLPVDVVEPINQHWGLPENNFMVAERDNKKYFVIPRIRNGNMLIMRQPPRGDSKDKEQGLYHKTSVPMNHYYLAAYYYAREYWGSDAFIHLGTHGSHEYLPGKERGLSRFDGGNLSTGTLPVIYPFIVDDVGEAMQTKRRGNAVTISHMTPPFAAAGLQGVTADIHELMHQYKSLDSGGVKEKTMQQIIDQCLLESLCEDMGYDLATIKASFSEFLEVFHDYLGELARENQPLGLHRFGELPEQRLVLSTVGQMLGEDFLTAAEAFETKYYGQTGHSHGGKPHEHKADARHHSHHIDKKAQDDRSGEITDNVTHSFGEDLDSTPGFKTLRDFVAGNGDSQNLSAQIKPFITQAKQHYKNMLAIKELDSLVAGLSGEYIAPKNGGDPVRNPESLPTGFNLIGFDPSRLPTKAAYAQGQELVEEVINTYRKKHDQYPDKLAFSLWSIEAMRHYGVLESQALYAMGIRPVWTPDGRVSGTEIIPAAELKRPRVDVVLSATGLYRDAFPNVMQLLAKAIQELAGLKEEGNSIWKNTQQVKAQLEADGMDSDEAQYLSSVRIFSNESGDYGSGVDGPIMESDTWDSDAKIADQYLARMGYYFGADKNRWGKKVENLYAKQLSGTDVAMFSRSSNTYGMITSDDPFEYFGSIALAVRNIDGKSPEMMISNLRDAQQGKMEMAGRFLARELRTRNFHKRWIEEMQKEGYSGAVTMAGSVANFWGWQVVDPNVVRDDQWQEFHEVYVEDKLDLGLNEWFEEVNPAAQAQLIERMLEAIRKDYWPASDATRQALIERYTELVEKYDVFVDNEKLQKFVNKQAAGFGLAARLALTEVTPALAEPSAQALEQPPQAVEGQKLEKVEAVEAAESDDRTLMWSLLVCLLVILAGAAYQAAGFRLRWAKKAVGQ